MKYVKLNKWKLPRCIKN